MKKRKAFAFLFFIKKLAYGNYRKNTVIQPFKI